MDEISNAYWVETTEHLGDCPVTRRTQHWIRINPATHVWRSEFVENGSGWSYDVLTETEHLHTASTWSDCTLVRRPVELSPEDLLSHVAAPASLDFYSERPSNLNSPWRYEDVKVDGISLVRCEKEVTSANFETSYRLLVDPVSRRFVTTEKRERDLRTGRDISFERGEGFAFNIDIAPSVFEMPAGKPIVDRTDFELFPGHRNEVPEEIREAAKRAIDQSDTGWQKRDPAGFSAAWRFNTVRFAPKKSDWLRLLLNNAGVWKEWSTEIERFGWWKGVSIQTGPATFRLSGGKGPITLMVHGKIHLVWEDNGQRWTGRTEFYLRKLWGKWRIVHWELPLEEIKAAHRNHQR